MAQGKQNLVIVDEPEENKPSRWTFHRYLKGIAFGKWWIIGATVLLAVGGYLGTKFLINRLTQNVSASFSYENIAMGSDGQGGGTFADGSRFKYTSLVSPDTIAAVQSSKQDYASLKTTQIVDNIGIAVSTYEDKDTGATVYELPNRFTITIKLSAFGDGTYAKQFLTDLIETANVKAQEAVAKHETDVSVPANFAELAFTNQLNLLSERRAAVQNELSGLIATFTENGVINESGTLLRSLNTDFNYAFDYYGVDIFTYLSDSLLYNRWVNYAEDALDEVIHRFADTADAYKERMRADIIDIATKQKKVDELIAAAGGMIVTDSQYAQLIAAYEQDIVDAQVRRNGYLKELKDMGYEVETFRANPTEANLDTIVLSSATGTLSRLVAIKNGTADADTLVWAEGCANFRASVLEILATLGGAEGYAKKVDNAYKYLYATQRSSVTYYNANVIVVSGTIPNIIGPIAGAVLGFVISSFICTAVFINKIDPIIDEKIPEKKKEEKE
ncbi:MAG: hypothetical protein K6E59_03150 [Bacilli bacterium]|nr:hypothetical protein [Bacilli bacterium]